MQNLRTLITLIDGGVMKKAQLVPVASLFQRRFQTADLPQQNLFVVASLIVQFIKPAAGSTKSHIMIKQAVIVQDFKGIQTVFRKEPLHLGSGIPPVVMVAFQQNFFPGQGVNKPKILQ